MEYIKEYFMYALGALITIGFFVILAIMVLDGNYGGDLSIVLGALIAAFSMVVSYFFGSSKGSADKDKLLKR